MKQVEREKESNKVYQPAPPKVTTASADKEYISKKSSSNQVTDRATFKTHMAQKYAKERERKESASTLISRSPEKMKKLILEMIGLYQLYQLLYLHHHL